MLVISRRKGQRIVIGDEIELVVTEIHKSSVRIGIVAPRGNAILRGEVRDSILAANREAASSSVDEAAILAATLSAGAGRIRDARLPIRRQAGGETTSQKEDAKPSAPRPASARPIAAIRREDDLDAPSGHPGSIK